MLELIMGILGTLLYPWFTILFVLLDITQKIFRGFAGIGTVWYGNQILGIGSKAITGENTGDIRQTGIVYYLLQTDLIYNMIWSIAILAIFLLVIFTFMAAFKNIYASKPRKWDDIIGKALLGLMNFVLVPVLCLFGVWMGNIVLNAVDGATTNGGSVVLSRKLFIAAAYNANYYRDGTHDQDAIGDPAKAKNVYYMTYKKSLNLSGNETNAELADIVDECYSYEDGLWITRHEAVVFGYHLAKINYLTLLAGGIFMLWVMISLSYAMIKRLFILLMLYVVSPVMCAMYPWDDGNALKSWRTNFVKNVLSAYGAVAGVNLFFSVLPVVENIKVGLVGFQLSIVKLLIIVCGMFAMKEFIGTLSGFIGADDALSQGTQMRGTVKKAVTDRVKKAGTIAAAGATAYFIGRGAARSTGSISEGWKAAGKDLGSRLAGSAGSSIGLDFESFKKAKKEGYQKGLEYDPFGSKNAERNKQEALAQKGRKRYEDHQKDEEAGVFDGKFATELRRKAMRRMGKPRYRGFNWDEDQQTWVRSSGANKGKAITDAEIRAMYSDTDDKKQLEKFYGYALEEMKGKMPASDEGKEMAASIVAQIAQGFGIKGPDADPTSIVGLGKRDKGRNESAVAEGMEIRGTVVASEIQARKTMIDELEGSGLGGDFVREYGSQWSQFKSGEHFEIRNGHVRLKDGEIESAEDTRFMQNVNSFTAGLIEDGNIALKQALEDSIDNQREYAKKVQDIAKRLGTTDIESVMRVLEGKLTSSTDKIIDSLIKMKKKIDKALDDKK